MKLEAMIFDLDGKLGDTLPVCYAAFREALQQHLGRTYSDAEIRALFGPSEEGVFQRLLPERWEEGMQTFLAAYDRAHSRLATTFPGLERALQALRERGVALAIVTGKGPHSAEISLRYLGLAPYFAVVEAGSPAGGIKPAAIRRALRTLGIPAERAVYVGDVTYDVDAAREAGVIPLAAAWAQSADAAALEARAPLAVFRTVDGFAAWIERNVEPLAGSEAR